MTHTALRNADLTDLVELLRHQQARKVDAVVPARNLWMKGGNLVVHGAPRVLEADGVTSVDGTYQPTSVFDEGLADKVKLPVHYLRRLRSEGRAHLLDQNVNELLHGWTEDGTSTDPRSFLVRMFAPETGEGPGVARAVLSDSYKIVDNLDVLMAALDGVKQAGVKVDITGADLTDRRMYVRLVAPEINALAPTLLRNYRSPFTGQSGADNPVVFGGFVLGNSETGGGAFTITPRLVVQVCENGMTISKDAVRGVHLGGKLDAGLVRYTADTQRKNLELIAAKTRDTVASFLDVEYVEAKISEIEAKSDKPLARPQEAIKVLGKQLSYTEADQEGILDHFIKGADTSHGGLFHAITSYAQTVTDADKAMEMEAGAIHALA